ncbi:threonine/serine exporter family protein [Lentilactobacillus laojiaonis]|uniref:threonine/serine exporter family protein n=1 Tax=Lentilactobacillus laojiaonis TaxID=2883998 RepID=UPI001D0AEDAE|nr:threonine/serine exporter family protein [Lentilactobacillus laojiaonis]UDM32344.1 threonine/serine exporter family protein [Lentilactobacillus laojiaonis]
MTMFILKVICVYLSTVGFGLIVNLPRRALNEAGIIGLIGWLVYYGITYFGGGMGTANFGGSLVIGLLSIGFARFKKMPGIIFQIPALVPLVPGGQAYQFIKNFAMSKYVMALDYLSQVIWIAGAIALGFIVAEIVFKVNMKLNKKRLKS